MNHNLKIETRSSEPIETRDEDSDDLAAAVQAVGELRSAVDQHRTAVDTRLTTEIRSLNERLDAIDVRTQRPGNAGTPERETIELRAAWLNYLRRGVQTPETELRALTVADDAQAGYLAPPETSKEIIRDITEISPIRQFASIRQSAAPSVRYPKRTGITNAKWEGEIEENEESNVTFGQIEIAAKRLTTFIDLSNSLLMGSDGAAEAEVRQALAEDFAQKEGLAFVSGDGFKEPEGLLTASAVPVVLNGHVSDLKADALISLMYSLSATYRNRGVWVLNGSSLAAIRKLKDAQGNYLWQPSYQAGQPETILGRPVAEAIDMPDIATNAFPIVFGDIGTGYRIIDRMQLGTLTDPYTQAQRAITRIHGTRWVGGGVVQPAAIRKLKMAT